MRNCNNEKWKLTWNLSDLRNSSSSPGAAELLLFAAVTEVGGVAEAAFTAALVLLCVFVEVLVFGFLLSFVDLRPEEFATSVVMAETHWQCEGGGLVIGVVFSYL